MIETTRPATAILLAVTIRETVMGNQLGTKSAKFIYGYKKLY